jgi:amino acid transporter
LGLVVEISGHLAPLAFVISGALTFLTGVSYSGLYREYKVPGGEVAFVEEATGSKRIAGHLGWALVLGYIFTNGLYAFTFGHYLANVFGAPSWLSPVAALSITAAILAVNLVGVGSSGKTELVTVWGKILILGGLTAVGIWQFQPEKLQPLVEKGAFSPLIAAAVIFISFEGYQLLAYDVDNMEEPEKNLPRSVLPAIATATLIYVAVALAALLLVSDKTLVEQREVALATVGRAALGSFGLWAVTVAALFSTASAINATLFGTARLAVRLAHEGQMPAFFRETGGTPRRALTVIAVVGGAFAMLGSIEQIVTFASLTFLAVFATVNFLWGREAGKGYQKALAYAGFAGLALAFVTVVIWLSQNRPSGLLIAAGMVGALALGRWWFVRRASGE